MKKNLLIALLLSLVVTGCQTVPKPTKTPLELQSIQAKEFETSKKIAFASTLSVFQDLGYIVESASFETGLITAKSPSQENFVPFVGIVVKYVKATAFIEEITPVRTKVRVNLLNSKNATNRGQRREKEEPIETPETYQDLFAKVQQGIFVRKNIQ
ncbi:MAG: hypothetical protein Q8L73_07625 [Methylotenera sp.]|nr:hypothetical protein [Methylotenera sp.]